MFDLNILPLQSGSQELAHVPGLLVAPAPRRAARGRNRDMLVIHLAFVGGSLPPSDVLDRTARIYFRSAGTVTAALRVAAEALNNDLMERNLRKTTPGEQVIGLLNLAAIHGDRLILAQSGPTHAFLTAAAGSIHLYDPQLAGRGLGLSRTLSLRFSQSDLKPGDTLILCAEPPDGWEAIGSPGERLDILRRRLLVDAPPDLSAVVVQFQGGSGRVNMLSGATATAPVSEPSRRLSGAGQPPQPAGEAANMAAVPAAPAVEEKSGPGEPTPPGSELFAVGQAAVIPTAAAPAGAAPVTPAAAGKPAPETFPARPTRERTALPRRERSGPSPWVRALAGLFRKADSAGASGGQSLGRALGRLLPGTKEGGAHLSPGTMFLIAIAVPLVVVSVAMAVYFQNGREEQYRAYYAQAAAQASQTQGISDPAALRSAWEKTLFYLDKAEAYVQTNESRALRQEAQNSLDGLDSILRLDYQPAIIGGLAQSVRVTRMAANNSDLYLLDGASGQVLRAILTGRGFELDPGFACGPGPSGGIIISQIVDIAVIPPTNEFKATLMALDKNGNLIYCTPGAGFTSAALAPPDNNWGKIQAMVMDSSSLYVLDPQTNMVWIYDGGVGGFSQRPRMFFDQEIPPMEDVVDLALANQNLYLLHNDGHLTQCTYGSVSFEPTRCTDPAPLTDNRPGRTGKVNTFSDAHFTQMLSIGLPTPALYMLDPQGQAIYLFSLQLRLQNQYREDTAGASRLPSRPATAFTIAPNRLVFMAFDNQVYYAVGQ